jgi:hypothetical protein
VFARSFFMQSQIGGRVCRFGLVLGASAGLPVATGESSAAEAQPAAVDKSADQAKTLSNPISGLISVPAEAELGHGQRFGGCRPPCRAFFTHIVAPMKKMGSSSAPADMLMRS